MKSQGALALRNLRKDWAGFAAVDGVSLDIHAGEFITLLGPSGSGKTTTLRMIAGLTKPTSGSILLNGRDISNLPPHRRNIGMVFQNYALFPHMSAAKNVGFALQMRNQPRHVISRDVDNALSLVGLKGMGDRFPSQLSGGQQQRVALARALVFNPPVLLMDEPLGALDKKLRDSLQLEIRRLHQELGLTVVYVTHDQEEALVMSDRIAVFNRGRIEQVGTGRVLYDQPNSIFVADFLGESNIFRGRLEWVGGSPMMRGVHGLVRVPLPTNGDSLAGERGAMIVRPEKVHVELLGSVLPPQYDRLEGRVLQAIFLGGITKFEIEVANRVVLRARRETRRDAPEVHAGDRVIATWSLSDCVVVSDPQAQAGNEREPLSIGVAIPSG